MDPEDLHEQLNSQISRAVTFLTPIVAALVALALAWLQDKIGLNLQNHSAEIAGFVVAIILGGCLTAAKWLEGRAGFERAAIGALQIAQGPTDAAAGSPEVGLEDDDEGIEDEPPPGAEGAPA